MTFTDHDIDALVERQLSLEEDTVEEAAKSYKDKLLMTRQKGRDMTTFTPERYLLASAVEKSAKEIAYWLLPDKKSRAGAAFKFKQTLRSLDVYELAYIVSRHMVNSMYDDASFQRVALMVGREFRTHVNYCRLKAAQPKLVKAIKDRWPLRGPRLRDVDPVASLGSGPGCPRPEAHHREASRRAGEGHQGQPRHAGPAAPGAH